MLKISSSHENSVPCLALEGRLDTLSSDAFAEALRQFPATEKFLIIDFAGCSYLASTGIRTLIAAEKRYAAMGGALLLTAMVPEVMQVLEMAGLHAIFRIHKSKADAIGAISKLQKKADREFDLTIGQVVFHCRAGESPEGSLLDWSLADMVTYQELNIALGVGSPAESLEEDASSVGLFFTIGNCSCFFPYQEDIPAEFRVVQDPAAGAIYLRSAQSFHGDAGTYAKMVSGGSILSDELVDKMALILKEANYADLKGMVIADHHPETPSLVIVGATDFHHPPLDQERDEPIEINNLTTNSLGIQLTGAKFQLGQLSQREKGESLLHFANRHLTFENIEGIELLKPSASFTKPEIWLFHGTVITPAESVQIKVETADGLILDHYKRYLTRRLYTDSHRVVVKQLHGGYSAQTFQVESFDSQGRRLRPTVLKMANRNLISREAAHCQQYSLPYILNNSAMVLGTAFFCGMGALRYNFVGIGGEDSQVSWLTHYFRSWSLEQLIPIYDKIFLKILQPWYGQAVQENIYPYREQNPTFTFFPTLCETAESLLGISPEDRFMTIPETGEQRLNPYWFLKHEYKARHDHPISYYTAICHGDLNMQNILLDKEMNVYLIDFSETKPRSVVSDFARLEAIFMMEHVPLDTDEELVQMIEFTHKLYRTDLLDRLGDHSWVGKSPEEMRRNLGLTNKMREYALGCTCGDSNIVPYYLALLEWILPIVCYTGLPIRHKKLSAYVAGLLCEQIMACDETN